MNPRTQTPIGATVLPLVIGIITMVVLPGDVLIELITAGTLFPAITDGLVVVLYFSVRRRLSVTEGAFSLGRLNVPIAIAALVWTIFAVVVLVSPTPIVIVVGLIAVGAAYLGSMLIFRRAVLADRPSAATPQVE